ELQDKGSERLMLSDDQAKPKTSGDAPLADTPTAADTRDTGAAAVARTAASELVVCESCGASKLPGEMSSVSDGCLECEAAVRAKREEARRAENDRWAEERAKGKAAFVRWNSGERGTFSRGKAAMHCVICDRLFLGHKTI